MFSFEILEKNIIDDYNFTYSHLLLFTFMVIIMFIHFETSYDTLFANNFVVVALYAFSYLFFRYHDTLSGLLYLILITIIILKSRLKIETQNFGNHLESFVSN